MSIVFVPLTKDEMSRLDASQSEKKEYQKIIQSLNNNVPTNNQFHLKSVPYMYDTDWERARKFVDLDQFPSKELEKVNEIISPYLPKNIQNNEDYEILINRFLKSMNDTTRMNISLLMKINDYLDSIANFTTNFLDYNGIITRADLFQIQPRLIIIAINDQLNALFNLQKSISNSILNFLEGEDIKDFLLGNYSAIGITHGEENTAYINLPDIPQTSNLWQENPIKSETIKAFYDYIQNIPNTMLTQIIESTKSVPFLYPTNKDRVKEFIISDKFDILNRWKNSFDKNIDIIKNNIQSYENIDSNPFISETKTFKLLSEFLTPFKENFYDPLININNFVDDTNELIRYILDNKSVITLNDYNKKMNKIQREFVETTNALLGFIYNWKEELFFLANGIIDQALQGVFSSIMSLHKEGEDVTYIKDTVNYVKENSFKEYLTMLKRLKINMSV